MKIYTKSGDQGTTDWIRGRVGKDDPSVEAYGTVDELNAFIGEAITRLQPERHETLIDQLLVIQHQLFDLGSDLAKGEAERNDKIRATDVRQLEDWIDEMESQLPRLTQFILPGGSTGASSLHLCRVVTRRAERRVTALQRQMDMNEQAIPYLNRLSDFFFVSARVVNQQEGIIEPTYQKRAERRANYD